MRSSPVILCVAILVLVLGIPGLFGGAGEGGVNGEQVPETRGAGRNGDGEEEGSIELVTELSPDNLTLDRLMFVNVTLDTGGTFDNASGNATILVRDPHNATVLMETRELAGGRARFMFGLMASDPNGTYTVFATARTSDASYLAPNTTFTYTNWTAPDPPPPPPPPPDEGGFLIPFIVAVGILTSVSLLGYSTERGRWGVWFLLVPLYSRMQKRDEALDNFNRGRIHRTIEENPGIRYNEIKTEIGIGNGTLTHHLRILQKERFVKGVGDRTLKRFYLWGYDTSPMPGVDRPLTKIQRSIVDLLQSAEWMTQRDITHGLQGKQQTVSRNLKALMNLRVVTRRQGSSAFEYALSPHCRDVLSKKMRPVCPNPRCRNQCPPGAHFCEICGTKLGG